jgi:ABC-2 type transport system permease protein
MNATLFKASIKSHWKMFVIFSAVMLMYLFTIISMFDPKNADALNNMIALLPRELVSAMGFGTMGTDLTAFISSYYYGFIIILFPMIYCIIAANSLIAKHVDRGSMAYLLSTPNTRSRIAVTQGAFLLLSILALLLFVAFCGAGVSAAMFPGMLDMGKFIMLNAGALTLFLAVSGICFLSSCIFNDSRMSLAFGAGIPVAFFVINMLSNVGGGLGWLKYFTIFTLFNGSKVVSGDSFTVPGMLILSVIGIASYITGIAVFNKKDMPL